MVAPGASVSEGQAVMELETDKAVVEVPSSVTGTIKDILVREGEKVKVGQVIFSADSNGASAPEKQSENKPEKKETSKKKEAGPTSAKPDAAEISSPAAAAPQPEQAAPEPE